MLNCQHWFFLWINNYGLQFVFQDRRYLCWRDWVYTIIFVYGVVQLVGDIGNFA